MSKFLGVFLFGFFCGCLLFFSFSFSLLPKQSSKSQEVLIEIFNKYRVGDDKSKVVFDVLVNNSYKKLAYSDTESIDFLMLETQRTFLLGNWVLVLCFKDSILVGKRFGVGDDVDVHPDDAPNKVGVCPLIN